MVKSGWRKCTRVGLIFLGMCVAVFVIKYFSPVFLSSFIEGKGNPKFDTWVYYIPGKDGYDIKAEISSQQIEELLQSTSVRRRSAFNVTPCPAIQVYVIFVDKIYGITAGKNGNIILSDMDMTKETVTTFWADSGVLFESLYQYHLLSGGEAIT